MPPQASSPYNPDILAAELGKLFELPLTAHMISRDGVEFEAGPSGKGVLRVHIMKSVLNAQVHQMFKTARIPSEDEVRREALEAELRAVRQELAELKAQNDTTVTGES